MTYDSNLSEAQQTSLPEMYKITCGSTIDRYTSFRTDVTFLGNTYEKKAIKRGNFSRDMEFGSVSVTIDAILSTTFRQFIANQPIEPVRITIYRALSTDMTDYVVLFNGQVKQTTINGNQIQVKCESKSDYLTKRIPKIIYQAYCNHDVFDTGCGLSEATWRVLGTLSSVSGNTIVSSAWNNAAGYADQYFKGGKAIAGTDLRLIVDHTDDTLTLQIPFGSSVTTGSEVYAVPGCDGNPETCLVKYDNLLKFLGMPYIPSRNPVLWGFR
jgi:uncharacterized phage protein (TIGR02218 family)